MPPTRAHYLFLAAWSAAAILAGSVLVSFHQPYLLPDRKISSLATRKTGWRALHLLSAECPCSRKVSDHLALRGPLKNLTEEIVFIGATDPFGNKARLEAEAYLLKTLPPEDLDSFGVKGVPLLIFLSPTGDIAYMGGYGAASDRDTSIWTRLQSNESVPALPVLGCAIGRRLQRSVDPFSLKYLNPGR